MSTLEYSSLPLNNEAVKIDETGRTDRGAYDRALMVAREVRRTGQWDGERELIVSDPYATYNGLDRGQALAVTETEYGALLVRLAEGDATMSNRNLEARCTVGSGHTVHFRSLSDRAACGAGDNSVGSRRRSVVRNVADGTPITCKKCQVKMAEIIAGLPKTEDPRTEIIPAGSAALTASTPGPLAENPAAVYLASLGSEASRRTMMHALNAIAELLNVPLVFAEREDLRRNTPGALVREDVTYLYTDWSALRYQHTAAIRAQLMERYSVAGANKMLSALRRVLKECRRLGLMTAEDQANACDIPNITGDTLLSGRDLDSSEIRALFAACAADTSAAGCRDAAIIGLLYGSALRRSECAKLSLADYDTVTGEMTVRKAKRNKERLVHPANGAAAALEDWLALRGDAPGPLFLPVSQRGVIECQDKPLTPNSIYAMLKRRGKEAGVRAFSPHDFRRTIVGDLLDAGADIVTIQHLLGHESVATTARYDRRPEEAKRKAQQLIHVPYTPRGREA